MERAVLDFLSSSPEPLSPERVHTLLDRVEAALQPLAGPSKDFPEEDLWDLGGSLALISPLDRQVVVARVGDFRIVLLRDGKLDVLAHEHTLRAQLEGQGQLLPADAALESVIVAFLGGRLPIPGDAITTAEVEVGDRLAIFENPDSGPDQDLAILLSLRDLPPAASAARALAASHEHSAARGQMASRAVCIIDVVG
jgi:protein phosphatase